MRVIESETVYECEYCNQSYTIKEDCEICEKACLVLGTIQAAVPGLSEAVDMLNKAERYQAAKVLDMLKQA